MVGEVAGGGLTSGSGRARSLRLKAPVLFSLQEGTGGVGIVGRKTSSSEVTDKSSSGGSSSCTRCRRTLGSSVPQYTGG